MTFCSHRHTYTHLDFCTVSNVRKNVSAVMLTSVGWGRHDRRNPGAASYAATPLCQTSAQMRDLQPYDGHA